jgi:putative DNA primase/helicase
LVDTMGVLESFRLDWRDYTNLPFSESRGQRRNVADKAENPLSKRGLVGAFCRAYDVEEAMAEFIPDIYIPGDDAGAKPRYSYADGTTSNGVVVEDDGLFIYSHHGSDPCGETLCNAFDMVRIHLFENLDEKKTENSSPKDWPSFKAMGERFADDEKVKGELLADRVDLDAMFDDISDPEDAEEARSEHSDVDDEIADLLAPSRGAGLPDLSRYKRAKKPKDNWHLKDLALDQHGIIKSSVPNIATIIQNDPRMHGSIARNELTGKVAVRKTISSKLDIVPPIIVEDRTNGEDWTDLHDHSIRAMMEAESGQNKPGWGIRVTDRDLNAAVMLVAQRNRFHPAVEYFESLSWDGVPRIDNLWIDYMGTPNTPYYRETSRLFMLAVVCRVYNPGHKWDHAPILKGGQGIRKSTFIKSLFGFNWSGELTANMTSGKDAVEQMLGKLALELPELATMRRGEVNDVKEFMTLVEDRVRLSYDKRMSTFKRQCVFMGTTNADEYLKDDTGNRRFWPIDVLATTIKTEQVEADRDQLWAEAYATWRKLAMTQRGGYRFIPLVLSNAAIIEAREYQALAQEEDSTEVLSEIIREWLETPVPLSVFLSSTGEEIPDFDVIGGEPMVVPTVLTPLVVAVNALHEELGRVTQNKIRLSQIGHAMRRLEGWRRTGAKGRIPGFGRGHLYELGGRTPKEFDQRYRIVGQTGEGVIPDKESDYDDIL